MKRSLPEVRMELLAMAAKLEDDASELTPGDLRMLAAELTTLAYETKRRPPTRPPAPAQSRKLSEKERKAIRDFALSPAGKGVSQMDMATKFGTNIGRVSEALRETTQ